MNITNMLISYELLYWYNVDAINQHIKMIEAGDIQNLTLLIVRLTIELEDDMDFVMLYSSSSRKNYIMMSITTPVFD